MNEEERFPCGKFCCTFYVEVLRLSSPDSLRWYENRRASKGTIVLEAQTLKEART